MATAATDLGSKPPAKARRAAASKGAKVPGTSSSAATNGSNGNAADPAVRRRGPGKMTDSHKEALAVGREEGRAVRNYLEALVQAAPHRGRPVTYEGLRNRLAYIDRQLAARPDPLARLGLVQQRMDTERDIENLNVANDMGEVEAAFIKAAPGYSQRRGISYSAWRQAGVEARVLKAAGIALTRSQR